VHGAPLRFASVLLLATARLMRALMRSAALRSACSGSSLGSFTSLWKRAVNDSLAGDSLCGPALSKPDETGYCFSSAS
jgi:hypothetical protein